MPIYEYVCRICKKRSSQLVLNYRDHQLAPCQYCGSLELDRVMSRFAAPKSEEARLESIADSSDIEGLDEQDPQSMARFMRKMKGAMGDEFADDVEAMMDEASGEELDESTEYADNDGQ